MTNAIEPATDTNTEPPATEPTPPTDEAPGAAGAEAAKYRRALRTAEAERDALTTRLEALQRAEVERLAADKLSQPAALWALGTNLTDCLDDDGNVDPTKAAEIIERTSKAHGLAAPSRWPDVGQGRRHATTEGSSWAEAMRPQRIR